MKRFHVHLHVQDLSANIAFYTRLFSAHPVREERDYAKWMLDDPPVNFAISTRGNQPGLDHLGIQVDSPEALAEMKASAHEAEMTMLDEGETTCCYARSEKHWITDPQGLAWEHFHTLGDIPVFHAAVQTDTGSACCVPAKSETASCCAPKSTAASNCCGPIVSKSSCC